MQRDQYNTVTHFPVLLPCEMNGRDGMANFLRQGALFRPVRELTNDDLDRNTARGNKTWNMLSAAEQKRLLGLIALRQAIAQRDALAVAKLTQAYASLAAHILGIEPGKERDRWTVEWFARKLTAQKGNTPQRVLAEILTNALSQAQLVLWWKDREQRFLPAIYCPNLATALYVRALISVVDGKALLVCPHCGEPFVQPRPDQNYCSTRCREAHRVARWRDARRREKSSRRTKP